MVDGGREVEESRPVGCRGVVLELNWDVGSLTLVGAFKSHMLASMPDLHNLPPPHPTPTPARPV